ncbi:MULTISPECIES: FliM/FliN family flagellar motor switch protein [unclassified Brenneria]|uniref:FliM/FliN family flagellar motor switch protein n=1 Tax=unclassified Brenneria TaxID=2634434 RepID=UPI0018F0D9A9|nr:FliM/FliN family flagellar motor switch protein [Brenneria sp. L3-3C-1]MBJ7220902.1 FliM/FliN family flagellar motor switch protein [Brenneria sp. L3-3C-1]MEE3642143.1 FliM/FliN family flagellar motor switch protein [Brenneria sp. L3_3C_1]
MNVRPLTLASISAEQAQVRQALAAGLTLPFHRDSQAGALHLRLADGESQDLNSHWRCDGGRFSLSEPAPMLSLLADCPLLPVTDAADPAYEWYWTLYNQSLCPALHALLGEIYPYAESETHHEPIDGWLTVSWNGIRSRSRIQTAASTWLALLSHAGWRRPCAPLPDIFTLSSPLVLAEAMVTPEALRHIQPGAVLLPNYPYFSPSGQGSVVLPPWRLYGNLQLTGLAPYRFTVTDMENLPVSSSIAPLPSENPAVFHQESDNVTDFTAPLPPLPVTLTVRCGNLMSTLPDLQRLAEGSVLTLSDVTPGEAWLYYGEIPLAQGDLVDVEGKLGLQITRLLSLAASVDAENTSERESAL